MSAGDGHPWPLVLIATGWFLAFGLRFLFPAILPQIKAAFLIGDTTAGLAITAIWAGYGLTQFPAGILVDRLDVRTVLTLSLLVAGVSLAAIGGAPVFPVFLVACGLFGLGSGLFGTARGIGLTDLFAARRGRAFGITLAAGSVGSAVLPLLAGVLIDDIGWRLTVGLSVPLFLVTAVGTFWVWPTNGQVGRDESGLTLAGVGRSFGEALGDRRVVLAVLGVTGMLFAFQGMTSFLPSYLIQEKGMDQATANTLFALLFIAGAGFQLGGGSAADAIGTRPVLTAVAVLGVATLASLPAVTGLVPLGLLIVLLASRSAVVPVANAYIIAALPDRAVGTSWGLLRTTFFLIGSTGSTVVGVFSDHGLFDEAFYALAGVGGLAAIAFFLLPAEGSPPGNRT